MTARRRPGRPRLYEGQRLVAYRLDAETRARIARIAEQRGISQAEVLRVAVLELDRVTPHAAPAAET
jgi:precorrin-6B methylase 2